MAAARVGCCFKLKKFSATALSYGSPLRDMLWRMPYASNRSRYARILHAPAAVEDQAFSGSEAVVRHVQRRQRQLCVDVMRESIAHDFPGTKIFHDCKMHPALADGDVGNVAHPGLIWAFKRDVSHEQVRCDRMVVVGVCGGLVGPASERLDAAVLFLDGFDRMSADFFKTSMTSSFSPNCLRNARFSASSSRMRCCSWFRRLACPIWISDAFSQFRSVSMQIPPWQLLWAGVPALLPAALLRL